VSRPTPQELARLARLAEWHLHFVRQEHAAGEVDEQTLALAEDWAHAAGAAKSQLTLKQARQAAGI
jgi:hypothetical protein